ncbi:hypothetical protein [Mesorhizobium sp. M7A.F.Ca.ET.027.03.2.1]|uniref:lysozyme inhibitor LprI family protein n=1 Tax=Mesorhizobium sp. M7A.F.Ca.ET.027.03.2.1 TaxID=2496656 RepID=UPI000FCB987A|nr:hypothetical protein [Mesorhizobium sp. M7A.F.Ca.ET.027.03.2.1]RVD64210.1 hypothetical protein EN750_13785 [Mesorhizobium sp. M7A.F.Ca.ET.027.03.2.1]
MVSSMRITVAVVVTLLLGAPLAFAASPSFDCAKATNADEKAICTNAQLAKNDQLTTDAFNQAKAKNRKAALATARGFLKTRAACGADIDCIANAQTQAVLDFALLGAQLPKPEPEPAKTDSTMSEIRTNCAAEWQGDYRMQEYCINQQTEALQAMKPVADSATPVEREILGKCANEWRKPVGFDYRMVKYCYEKQIEAYRRLN